MFPYFPNISARAFASTSKLKDLTKTSNLPASASLTSTLAGAGVLSTYISSDYFLAFFGAGFSSSDEESESELLSFLAGAFFEGAVAFLATGFSSSDDEPDDELSFFAGAFLAGAATALTGATTAFLGAGFSSSDEESDEELSFFAGAFLAGAATTLAGAAATTFLGAGFSSSEDESDDELSFFAGAFLAGAATTLAGAAATAFLGAGLSSDDESLEELSFLAIFLTGATAFLPLITSTSESELLSLTTFLAGAAFLAGATTTLAGAATPAFLGAGLSSDDESLEELSFFVTFLTGATTFLPSLELADAFELARGRLASLTGSTELSEEESSLELTGFLTILADDFPI